MRWNAAEVATAAAKHILSKKVEDVNGRLLEMERKKRGTEENEKNDQD